MRIYIDQSGKIEATSQPTILAFTNSQHFTIKITPRTKKQIQNIFRRQGRNRLFIDKTFATLIFILIKNYLKNIQQIIIDTEYPGHEKLIRDIVIEHIRKANLHEPTIIFKRIGNRPEVHYLAYNVFVKKKKPNKIINFSEIMALIKKDRGRKRLKNA